MSATPKKDFVAGKVREDGATRAMVLRLAREGLGIRTIAGACGVSTQAVHYHLKKLREAGEFLEEGA